MVSLVIVVKLSHSAVVGCAFVDNFQLFVLYVSVTQPQAGSSQKNNTVHMLNLNNLKSLTVEKEPSGEKEAPLPSLDNAKVRVFEYMLKTYHC